MEVLHNQNKSKYSDTQETEAYEEAYRPYDIHIVLKTEVDGDVAHHLASVNCLNWLPARKETTLNNTRTVRSNAISKRTKHARVSA